MGTVPTLLYLASPQARTANLDRKFVSTCRQYLPSVLGRQYLELRAASCGYAVRLMGDGFEYAGPDTSMSGCRVRK